MAIKASIKRHAKQFFRTTARSAGFEVRTWPKIRSLPDAELYQPFFSPWRAQEFFGRYDRISRFTLVSEDRCYVLDTLSRQASHLAGEIWECGVYRGGTAMLLAQHISATMRPLRLFDTFAGMPETDTTKDLHKAGDFNDTDMEQVRMRVGARRGDLVQFHQGLIPETFKGLESAQIAFAHVDLDIYSAVRASCEFIFPRLCAGGFIVLDDYGQPSCPGARLAVDGFFRETGIVPLCLPTGQAVVFRSF